MEKKEKIYFISDVHLGASALNNNKERERHLVKWLRHIESEATELFLVGDIFDYWFEYNAVVPKGFTRFFGQLSHMSDQGIKIHFFSGNHDFWAFNYFEEEIGIKVYFKPQTMERCGKKLFIGHGDGLNPKDKGYILLKKVFANKIAQRLFSWIHPDISCYIAHRWSRHSRLSHSDDSSYFDANQGKEEQLIFAQEYLQHHDIDYFIFGHRHVYVDHPLQNNSRLLILGEWINTFSYAMLDETGISLNKYPMEE